MRAGLIKFATLLLLMTTQALLATTQAVAVDPGEALADPALEARARALSAEFRCLVCQNQSIDDSDAPLARDLRLLVRDRLLAGDSDAEIRDFVVARYGAFALLKPQLNAQNLLLWLAPMLLLLGGLGFVFVFFKSRPASVPPSVTASVTNPSPKSDE
jgi:cytochrome c-type biogenesis protein CcmH